MLKEKHNIRQIESEGFRRWFFDTEFDLIVWYESESAEGPFGFQLCYDKPGTERALTWSDRHGYSHTRVDDGEVPFSNKMTPVLVADGVFERDDILARFREAAGGLDPSLRSLIESRIEEYPG